jgi:hypothetical protein
MDSLHNNAEKIYLFDVILPRENWTIIFQAHWELP